MTETLISVDVEASGPIPWRYSMLSLGACLVDDPTDELYLEFQPVTDEFVAEAVAVSGLDLAKLQVDGSPPAVGMTRFAEWLVRFECPVFVGFNASFDWAFVNHYFIEYGPAARNPFGIGAVDIKAYAMGRLNATWNDTRSSRLAARLGKTNPSAHNALEDAQQQADLFRAIRDSL
jgi:DNA polymerase III epsilon subunit-like protein